MVKYSLLRLALQCESATFARGCCQLCSCQRWPVLYLLPLYYLFSLSPIICCSVYACFPVTPIKLLLLGISRHIKCPRSSLQLNLWTSFVVLFCFLLHPLFQPRLQSRNCAPWSQFKLYKYSLPFHFFFCVPLTASESKCGSDRWCAWNSATVTGRS